MLAGTLGVTLKGGKISGFKEFVEKISLNSQAANPFLRKFWEEFFSCSCPKSICPLNTGDFYNCKFSLRLKFNNKIKFYSDKTII